MSALAEINAMSGSASVIVPELSAAGDCCAGTPGKYRPLRAPKLCSSGGDTITTTWNQDISISVLKTGNRNDSEVITDKNSNEQDGKFCKKVSKKEVHSVETGNDNVEMKKSCPGKVVQRSSPCQYANINAENSNPTSNKARNSSDSDGGDENFELSVDPNQDSCRVPEQDPTTRIKQKSTKGGILQAMQSHLPKFSLKKPHADKANHQVSVLSETECSVEKKSGNKEGQHIMIQEENKKLEECGKTYMAKKHENIKIDRSCQVDDIEQDKPILSENDNVKENSQGREDTKGSTPELTTMTTCTGTDQQGNDRSAGIQFDGKNEGNTSCAKVGIESCTDKTKTFQTNVGLTGKEPSSVHNSSLGSADFYMIPPSSIDSSIDSSTDPSITETTSGYQHEDSSATKQNNCSSVGEDEDSLHAEVNNVEQETLIEINSDSVTDWSVQKPGVIPKDEENTDGFESPCSSLDHDQSQKAFAFSSSNQSSLDTNSPGFGRTPEHSPKKKPKRRVPILNVALPSFGKKHHRLTKSAEQSSDSDKSGSPTRKFPWKKKNPKMTVAVEAVSSGSVDSEAKIQSELPDKKTPEVAEIKVEVSSTRDEDSKVIYQNTSLQVPEEVLKEKWKKEEETEAEKNVDEEMYIPDDDNQDGKVKMSASLELHTSSTPHALSPTDLSDESKDIGDSAEGDVSVELTAAEKILEECNQLVAEDSVGDIQFTPDMLSEINKTISTFEEEEEKTDKVLDVGAQDYSVHFDDAGSKIDKSSLDGLKSDPVDVECQMPFDDGRVENEQNAPEDMLQKVCYADVNIDFSYKQKVNEKGDKRSISSSSSPADSQAEKRFVMEISAPGEITCTVNADTDISVAEPLANTSGMIKENEPYLPHFQRTADSLNVRTDKSSLSRDQIQPEVEVAASGVTSAEPNEGFMKTTGEKTASDVKQKARSKRFLLGINFQWLKLRGRHSGKVDNSSNNDEQIDEIKIGFQAAVGRTNTAEISDLSKASSEVNINRRRSVENKDDFVMDNKTPSVPDISEGENRTLRKTKKKSFTMPNVHLHLPKFSTKKTPNSGVSGGGPIEVAASGSGALKAEIPLSDTLPEAHSSVSEAVDIEAPTVQPNITDPGEKEISVQIHDDNPQTDELFNAVPHFVQEDDKGSKENIPLSTDKKAMLNDRRKVDVDIDTESQDWEVDFSLPILNDVQAKFSGELEPIRSNEAEVTVPLNHTEEEFGLPCTHSIGINNDDIRRSASTSGQFGLLNADTPVENDVQEVDNDVKRAGACEKGNSKDNHARCIESKMSGESEYDPSVNIDSSLQLDFPPEDRKVELEVKAEKDQMPLQTDGNILNETNTKAPGLKNSPTKHKFKFLSFNFYLPKFHGLHSPTIKSVKKAKTTATPPAEVLNGANALEKCNESVLPEVENQYAVECELTATVVRPEIDIKGDLKNRLGHLEKMYAKNPAADINEDVRVKLNFDETSQMTIPEAGLKQNDKVMVPSNLDVQLPDISLESDASPTYLKDDGKHYATAPSQDQGSSVDLQWEDEICSRVQVTEPTFRLSDIKGCLSLGVALSKVGMHNGTEEKMQLEEPDGDQRDCTNAETTSALQLPSLKQSLPVDADLNSRSTSTHALAKSVSSCDTHSNGIDKPKKKNGIIPKIHTKFRSPHFKSPERSNEDPKHVDCVSENAHTDSAGVDMFQKKPCGKRLKKGRRIPGKSAKKGKLKLEYGGNLERPDTTDRLREDSDLDIGMNAVGNVEANRADHPNWELNLQPRTLPFQSGTSEAGPSTSTPMKSLLSLNNSAQTTPITPNSNTSLTIEQAIAVHSSPASPISPQALLRRPYTVVVAIDFGTTFSGYAYSFTRDPEDIQIMRKWEGGDPGVTNMKTPTTLLLHPDGEFHSFGFTARDYYHDMDYNEALRWLYFEKFKLALHNDLNLNLETELTAANGRRLPAIKVFEHALRFFRHHAMEELCDQSNDGRFDPEDIRWVLTVPAIWKQPAKQFMREAAYRAGLAYPSSPEQLLIALEPEVASICIRKLRMRELVPDQLSQRRKWSTEKPDKSNSQVAENITHGTRYMVVDCGGGTVDITVHEVEEEASTLKELHKATGGMYGSVSVDAEFEKLLVDIFSKDFIEEFKIKRPAGWVDLMIAFESRKRNANPYKNNPLNVSLPFSFIDYYKKYTHDLASVEDAIWTYKHRDVTWSAQGMLRLSSEGMQHLFRPAVANIISLVEGLLNEPQLKGVSFLFLAGGFAQSPLLQIQMRKKFASRLRVIIPRDVGLTILKGAVMFGLDPTAVRVRRSRLTYGVGVLNKFSPDKHPKEKHVVKDNAEWCKDVFDTFVMADQSVALGDKVTRSYTPAKSTQKSIIVNIYCTEKDKVQFITDEGVQKCGSMHIDVSDSQNASPSMKRRELQLTMQYGDTEIKVRALDVPTGRCVNSNIDFLSK